MVLSAPTGSRSWRVWRRRPAHHAVHHRGHPFRHKAGDLTGVSTDHLREVRIVGGLLSDDTRSQPFSHVAAFSTAGDPSKSLSHGTTSKIDTVGWASPDPADRSSRTLVDHRKSTV
jgi:hypothetical protein